MKYFFYSTLMLFVTLINASATLPLTIEETKTINTEESTVLWTGKKVTGQHTGTIGIKSGSLKFNNGTLSGGNITIDMNSITCTDLREKGAQKLVGHLKSDDFFGVPNHPTAELNITTVAISRERNSYQITADITIKEITKSITFTASVGVNEASAKIIIDRTDFDVKYGSGSFFDDLGDKTIYDDFELEIKLKY